MTRGRGSNKSLGDEASNSHIVDRASRINGLSLIQDKSSILAPSHSVFVVDCDGKAKARNGLPCGRQTQIVPYLLSSESSIFEGGRGGERERGVRNSQIA